MKSKVRLRLASIPPVIWIILALFILYSYFARGFFSAGNLWNIGVQAAPLLVLAIGATMVILTEGIDLSCGIVLGFAGVGFALLVQRGFPIWLAMLGRRHSCRSLRPGEWRDGRLPASAAIHRYLRHGKCDYRRRAGLYRRMSHSRCAMIFWSSSPTERCWASDAYSDCASDLWGGFVPDEIHRIRPQCLCAWRKRRKRFGLSGANLTGGTDRDLYGRRVTGGDCGDSGCLPHRLRSYHARDWAGTSMPLPPPSLAEPRSKKARAASPIRSLESS